MTRPPIHGRDHAPGGADPIPGLGGGGADDAIHYGDNTGDRLVINATDPDGIILSSDATTGSGVVGMHAVSYGHVQVHEGGLELFHYGGLVQLGYLPTTDPMLPHALWDAGGKVVLSGYADDGGEPGPPGPPGPPGADGADGDDGAPGPNLVDTNTPSPLVGILNADGSTVGAAVAGTDYVTPAQLGNKVDRDAVEAASARLVAVKLAAGDTQPSFKIRGDGELQWGPGGASAPDLNFRRSAGPPVRVMTDQGFQAAADIIARAGSASTFVGVGLMGPAGQPGLQLTADTNLFRAGAATLQTGGTFVASNVTASTAVLVGAGATRVQLNAADGGIYWGGDTVLHRTAAAQLHTNAHLTADGGVSLRSGTDHVELHGRLRRQGGQIRALILTINGDDYRVPLQPV